MMQKWYQQRTASVPALSEKNRLLHRLNCIHLNEEEIKRLQAYLTLILENRNQEAVFEETAIQRSGSMVLEMSEEEFQKLACHVGESDTRLFHILVESDNNQAHERKLAIFGDSGLRLFHVLVKSSEGA